MQRLGGLSAGTCNPRCPEDQERIQTRKKPKTQKFRAWGTLHEAHGMLAGLGFCAIAFIALESGAQILLHFQVVALNGEVQSLLRGLNGLRGMARFLVGIGESGEAAGIFANAELDRFLKRGHGAGGVLTQHQDKTKIVLILDGSGSERNGLLELRDGFAHAAHFCEDGAELILADLQVLAGGVDANRLGAVGERNLNAPALRGAARIAPEESGGSDFGRKNRAVEGIVDGDFCGLGGRPGGAAGGSAR
jgi:hypothetical protein